MDKDDMKEEQIRALEGLANPTPEQRAAAKALGLAVVYRGSTGQTRILTREETRKEEEEALDPELYCPKPVAEFIRRWKAKAKA